MSAGAFVEVVQVESLEITAVLLYYVAERVVPTAILGYLFMHYLAASVEGDAGRRDTFASGTICAR